ncbi:MAG TPA: hypothetical protein VIV60_04845, partial [Polyangiaceae bacterium]
MNRCFAKACVCWVVLGTFGCSRKDAAERAPTATAVMAAASPSATSSTAVAAAGSGSVTPSLDIVSETVPESFADATAVINHAARGLGCETKSKQGWLQILCRKTNGTGGHPKRAVMGAEADALETLPDAHGELKLVLPWRGGGAQSGTIEWTDTKYTLQVKDTELKLDWVSSLELRRSCANLEKASKAVVAAAQTHAAAEHLTAAEAGKLPRFGICQPAGTGSWAIVLRGLSVSEVDAERSLKFELDVAHVDLEGVVAKHELGNLEAKLGGLELRQLVAFDYDDDGSDELVVPYDLKAIAARA